MAALEGGPAFHERVSRAFNLCTVCFAAHVRVALGAGGVGDEIAAERFAKGERSDVARDVDGSRVCIYLHAIDRSDTARTVSSTRGV